MNRRQVIIWAVGVSALLTASIAWPQTKEKVVAGTINAVTADSLTITEADGKTKHVLMIDKGTAVTIDSMPVKPSDLKSGDQVRAFLGPDGKLTRIEATREKKPKP